ncbi:hypothetical protein Hanom_Chr10g00913701 [Helianthus anomalus]
MQPPFADSERRIQAIKLLPKIKRSFIPYPASSSQHSSLNMSDASKVPILLDLDELDNYPTPQCHEGDSCCHQLQTGRIS